MVHFLCQFVQLIDIEHDMTFARLMEVFIFVHIVFDFLINGDFACSKTGFFLVG
jgi:hypothetical protein